jgi:hypothetical protein
MGEGESAIMISLALSDGKPLHELLERGFT